MLGHSCGEAEETGDKGALGRHVVPGICQQLAPIWRQLVSERVVSRRFRSGYPRSRLLDTNSPWLRGSVDHFRGEALTGDVRLSSARTSRGRIGTGAQTHRSNH